VLASSDSDDAIREIVRDHRSVLLRCGLSASWIDAYGLEDLGATVPQWQENVRIFTWWFCPTQYESDDEIVTALIVDSRKTRASHTGIFLSPCGEYLAFECVGRNPRDRFRVAYKRIRDGLVDFNDDTREAYPPAWVDANKDAFPELTVVLPGIEYCEWRSDLGHEDFNHLRLYLFENEAEPAPSPYSSHAAGSEYGEGVTLTENQ